MRVHQLVAVVVVSLTLIGPAQAGVISLEFPSEDATTDSPFFSDPVHGFPKPLGAGGGGVFFNKGDSIQETFNDTGLATAVSSRWIFSMSNLTEVGVVNTFAVLINGTTVGTFDFAGDGDLIFGTVENFDLTFNHAAIAGDDYTLRIVATSTVPDADGSWNWIPGGEVILSDEPNAVPEPASLTLVGLGTLGMAAGAIRRRRGKAAAAV